MSNTRASSKRNASEMSASTATALLSLANQSDFDSSEKPPKRLRQFKSHEQSVETKGQRKTRAKTPYDHDVKIQKKKNKKEREVRDNTRTAYLNFRKYLSSTEQKNLESSKLKEFAVDLISKSAWEQLQASEAKTNEQCLAILNKYHNRQLIKDHSQNKRALKQRNRREKRRAASDSLLANCFLAYTEIINFDIPANLKLLDASIPNAENIKTNKVAKKAKTQKPSSRTKPRDSLPPSALPKQKRTDSALEHPAAMEIDQGEETQATTVESTSSPIPAEEYKDKPRPSASLASHSMFAPSIEISGHTMRGLKHRKNKERIHFTRRAKELGAMQSALPTFTPDSTSTSTSTSLSTPTTILDATPTQSTTEVSMAVETSASETKATPKLKSKKIKKKSKKHKKLSNKYFHSLKNGSQPIMKTTAHNQKTLPELHSSSTAIASNPIPTPLGTPAQVQYRLAIQLGYILPVLVETSQARMFPAPTGSTPIPAASESENSFDIEGIDDVDLDFDDCDSPSARIHG